MARVTYGGTASDYVTNRRGDVQPDAELEVRDAQTLTAVTDLVAPAGYTGLPFPSGRARADTDGLVEFLGPDGVDGLLEARTAQSGDTPAGPWVLVSPRYDAEAAAAAAIQARLDDGTILTQAAGDAVYVSKGGNLAVDVRDYGAALDGVTDDTQAFLDAIATGRGVPHRGAAVPVPPGPELPGHGGPLGADHHATWRIHASGRARGGRRIEA